MEIDHLPPPSDAILTSENRPILKPKSGLVSSHPHDTPLFINLYPTPDLGLAVDDSDGTLHHLTKYMEDNNFDLRGICNFLSSPDTSLQCASLQLLEHAAKWQETNFIECISVTFGPVANLVLDSRDIQVHCAALDTLKTFLESPQATDIVISLMPHSVVDTVSNDLNSPDPNVQLASVELLEVAAQSEEILNEFATPVSRIFSALSSMPTATQIIALRVIELGAGSNEHEILKALAANFYHLKEPLSSPEVTIQATTLKVLEASARTKDPGLSCAVQTLLPDVKKLLLSGEADLSTAARRVLEVDAYGASSVTDVSSLDTQVEEVTVGSPAASYISTVPSLLSTISEESMRYVPKPSPGPRNVPLPQIPAPPSVMSVNMTTSHDDISSTYSVLNTEHTQTQRHTEQTIAHDIDRLLHHIQEIDRLLYRIQETDRFHGEETQQISENVRAIRNELYDPSGHVRTRLVGERPPPAPVIRMETDDLMEVELSSSSPTPSRESSMTVRQQREDITIETLGDPRRPSSRHDYGDPHQSPSRHTERRYGSHRDDSPNYYLRKRRRPPHDDDDDDSEDRRRHRHDSYSPAHSKEDGGGRRRDDRRRPDRRRRQRDSYSPTPSEEDYGGRRRDDRRRPDRRRRRRYSYSPTPSEEDDGGRRRDGRSVPPIPSPVPCGSADNASIIESIHAASQEAASRHATDILEVVHLEREQFERERQDIAAERERERAEFNAERALMDDERARRIHELEEELARVRGDLDNGRQIRRTENEERVAANERDEGMRAPRGPLSHVLFLSFFVHLTLTVTFLFACLLGTALILIWSVLCSHLLT